MQQEEHQHCLLCNSPEIIPMKKYGKDHLVKCKKCGFVFCKKIPTEKDLIENYKLYHRDNAISPITVKRYNELLDTFETSRKNNKILDIGCGDGHFLHVAKQRGWEVYGTEFTDEAIEVCKSKNINMSKGVLNPENYAPFKFDVITSFEVIEHINNPQSEVKNIVSLLRPEGIFYFTTPNFNSVNRAILKEKWSIIVYPEHLSYYTAKTINRFFSSQGLKKINLRTTGISINRLMENPTSDAKDRNVNKDEQIRERTESNKFFLAIKNCVNFTLNVLKIGDTLKGTYRKV